MLRCNWFRKIGRIRLNLCWNQQYFTSFIHFGNAFFFCKKKKASTFHFMLTLWLFDYNVKNSFFYKMDETQWQRFLSNALIFFKDFDTGKLKKTACVTFELRVYKKMLSTNPKIVGHLFVFPSWRLSPFSLPIRLGPIHKRSKSKEAPTLKCRLCWNCFS